MKRALCVWLPDWPIQRLTLAKTELEGTRGSSPAAGNGTRRQAALGTQAEHGTASHRDRAIVLYEIYRAARRVIACSPRAASLGIAPGMSLSEATSLAEAATAMLHVEAADPAADHQMLEKLAQACQQFSPVVGLEESESPESLLLDITGLAHLFQGEGRLAEELLRSLARRHLVARIGVADTVGAAWAAAHFGGGILPPQETMPALQAMPVEALRLPVDVIDLLHQLGVYRIGQLSALPREDFNARFGPELLRRWDQAFGQIAEPIQAQPFPSELQADQALEQPTARRETIEFLLQQLIGRVAEMLFRSGRGATQFECRLHCGTTKVDLSVGLFQPTGSPQHLWQLVQMRLERIALPGPVTEVSVRAATTTLLQRQQQELFCDRRDAERPRFLAALIDRISSRLGYRAVLRPRLVRDAQPELAYHYDPLVEAAPGQRRRRLKTTQSIGAKRNLPGRTDDAVDLPMRPLKLVGRPVSLAAVSILPDGPPLQFHWQGREHRIADRWGPERIQTGWWRGQAVGRDYYRIETTAGRHFWLFRRLRDGRWFMHGMFE